jgi:hypothetical protein
LIGFRLRNFKSALAPGINLALACMAATALGKVLGIWLGVQPPFVLALVALPPAIVFFYLQAGDARQMINSVFRRTVTSESSV